MNDFDRDNLEFFLTVSSAVFDQWLEQATPEEVAYAINLIRLGNLEKKMEEADLLEQLNPIEKFPEAKSVIDRIRAMK